VHEGIVLKQAKKHQHFLHICKINRLIYLRRGGEDVNKVYISDRM
jgi:hypothetical protein